MVIGNFFRLKEQIGGWILTPLEGNPEHTRLKYAVELDLKGSIPGFVVKKACTD